MVDSKGCLEEFLPSNKERVVDGVQVKEDSSRVFISCNEGQVGRRDVDRKRALAAVPFDVRHRIAFFGKSYRSRFG